VADEPEHTIDELAALTRVPSRTIRFYQAKGALMPPTIRGRVAYYGPAHRERLERIAQLQDRGLRIAAIRDLMTSIDRGEVGLAEWLGVEREVQASWAEDRPRTVTTAELYELAGSRRAGLLADLTRAGLVTRRGEVWLLHSPALLAVAMRLEAADIDLETTAGAAKIVRKHVARLADELVDYHVKRVRDGSVVTDDLGALFGALRPGGIEAVRVVFGREMERALRELLASGKLAQLPARRSKRAARGKPSNPNNPKK
jgi:DNA-binding transcriptional MerR regulator